MKNWIKRAILLSILSGVVACGGGGGGGTTPPVQNSAPTANAGADQAINTGDVVNLSASGSSDANGDTLTYQWSLTTVPAGSSAALSSATISAPTFTADTDGTYVIQLIVNDGTVNSTADSLTVTATTPNVAPIASAGADQNVNTGSVVTLTGAASADANNDILTYSWSISSLPAGSAASLTNATALNPTFTADVDGTYTVQLIVNDNTVDSAADSVNIVASTPNTAPMANAGIDQNVETGTLITLNGTASSDIDGDPLTYLWVLTRPTGSSATLSNTSIASPTFTADVDGTYTAVLTVNDSVVSSATDSVSIVATTANSAPVANAGVDQPVNTGTLVTLNGSSSTDADGDNLTYQWSLVIKPTGSTATLNNATLASPTFTADVDGTYTAELTVNDTMLNSAVDSVTITASTANSAPVANAGIDQNVTVNTLVTLDGSASSDANGDLITYQWSLLSTPTGNTAVMENADTSAPSFTPNVEGTYTAQLIVNDTQVSSAADNVNIVVSAVNSAPVANAGEDDFVTTSTIVTLDGSGSTDANNDILMYTWSFVSKPTGSAASFDNNEIVNPSFTTDLEGSYVISLVVFDGAESSAADNVQILVSDTTIGFAQKVGIFGDTFNDISFPYSSSLTVNFDITGSPPPTTVTPDTFKITALGGDLTIVNLQVTNSTNSIVPYFTAISEGFVLQDGVTTEFGLVSPLTDGVLIDIKYSFEIAETGQTFLAIYRLKTN